VVAELTMEDLLDVQLEEVGEKLNELLELIEAAMVVEVAGGGGRERPRL
jgi:hypothetical protein